MFLAFVSAVFLTLGYWFAFDVARPARRIARVITSFGDRRSQRPGSAVALLSGALVGVALGLVAGALTGCAFGSLAAFFAVRVRTRVTDARTQVTDALTRSSPHGTAGGARQTRRHAWPVALPAALDLLAACLAAGAPVDHALESVAGAFGQDSATCPSGVGPSGVGSSGVGSFGVGPMLGGVARLTALGAPPETAWAPALADPRWAPVARSVVRAHHSGASLTDVFTRAADDRRRALRADAEIASARAAVRVVLPLGLCFLPAFVLIGVVPVVAGFASTLWG